MVFDVNDFDEAYLGRFTWDLQRFAASLALVGWQKALPEDDVRRLIGRYVRAYLSQVDHYRGSDDDDDFALHLDNTSGPVHARAGRGPAAAPRRPPRRRHGARRGRPDVPRGRLGAPARKTERAKVVKAFEGYLETIPRAQAVRPRAVLRPARRGRRSPGFGIGSAGLPAYNLLVEGYSQALDNDVVLSMKQANIPAVSRFVDTARSTPTSTTRGTARSSASARCRCTPTRCSGHTELDGVGYVVSEISPYEVDLDWSDLTEPEEIADVVDLLGRATAKIHCASDEDSEQDLVDFQVEEAIAAGRRAPAPGVHRAGYRLRHRRTPSGSATDHALFVDAFREGRIGVSAT